MSHFFRTIFPAALGCTVLGLGLSAAAPASAQVVLAESNFTGFNEGWTLVPNEGPAPHVPLLFGTNEGGYIANYGSSSALGWKAPEKFLGDKSAAVGGRVSFRLSDGDDLSGLDGTLSLVGGGLALSWINVFGAPQAWTQYHIPLAPVGLWVTSEAGVLRQTTQQDFELVLGNLQGLLIYGRSLNPEYAALLDDVVLYAAVPEPGTWALWVAGLSVLGAMGRRRRAVLLDRAAG